MKRAFAILPISIVFAGCVVPSVVSDAQIAESLRTGICCVHGVSMKATATAIRYGFIVAPKGDGAHVERSRFPFAYRRINGGHTLGPPWFAEILVCDDCTSAKKSWIRSHPRHPLIRWWTEDLEEPNKALEPTTGSVTLRATSRMTELKPTIAEPNPARSVPAPVVAHL